MTHILMQPYHPESNVAVKRAVQTISSTLKKTVDGSFFCELARILLIYRPTPPETTGCSQVELVMIADKFDVAESSVQKSFNRLLDFLFGSRQEVIR
ncbi:hypothetical protein HPB48_011911 [Haemaphysalis longicornis]|uniref:Integrase catalytic domain-containing protein n=1 Tax=Haemaphysalis longicornis TaxID=44386 RepID=A0A9J6GRF3_HAELO|nr:hypothetical protein HPB48_011911 [Haemaphysalis longicornis]